MGCLNDVVVALSKTNWIVETKRPQSSIEMDHRSYAPAVRTKSSMSPFRGLYFGDISNGIHRNESDGASNLRC
jgi:hypothetical protein